MKNLLLANHMINVVLIFLSLVLAYFFSCLLCKSRAGEYVQNQSTRLGCIDGLRGYLALMVFVSHFVLTYTWKHLGVWKEETYVYMQALGQVAVGIFFMITSFLFVYRILVKAEINWPQLLCSRVFRIYPLYLFVFLLLVMVVGLQTNFELVVSTKDVLVDVVRWLLFCGISINDYPEARVVMAKVDWTLRYEWLFYCSLPAIAWLIKRSKVLLVLLVLSTVYFSVKPVHLSYLFFFMNTRFLIFFLMGGLIAYLKYRYPDDGGVMKESSIAILGLLAILLVPIFFDTAYGVIQSCLLFVFFLPIVYGNDYFGILSKKASLLLGEISYSIYLMHGIILFVVLTVVFPDYVLSVAYNQYLLLMPILVVSVILIAHLSYRFIERPMIACGRSISEKYFAK